MSYQVRRPAQQQTLMLRGLEFQLYHWPGADPRPIVFVHGWGDAGETWQFTVDHLSPDRTCIAFDMRGFGRSQRPVEGYWFADYLADLDALLDRISPAEPVDLVGHSMGGNVVLLYAGVRAHRVRRVVSLDGLGLPHTSPEGAPARYAQWLDELRDPPRFATYDDESQFIRVLTRRNPRTPIERIEFIARCWAQRREDGRLELRADPRHKQVNPTLYQRDQAEACWRAITAPVLLVIAGRSEFAHRLGAQIAEDRLRSVFRNVTITTLAEAGHMLHHEQPQEVSGLLERFLQP